MGAADDLPCADGGAEDAHAAAVQDVEDRHGLNVFAAGGEKNQGLADVAFGAWGHLEEGRVEPRRLSLADSRNVPRSSERIGLQ